MTPVAKLLNGAVAGLLFTATVLAQDRSVVDWLRTNAIPLATVEAGHGFADLEPLKTLIVIEMPVGANATHINFGVLSRETERHGSMISP